MDPLLAGIDSNEDEDYYEPSRPSEAHEGVPFETLDAPVVSDSSTKSELLRLASRKARRQAAKAAEQANLARAVEALEVSCVF